MRGELFRFGLIKRRKRCIHTNLREKKKNRNALTSVYASFYQEYLSKDLTEKYGALNAEMEKVIHEANTEISSLQNRLSGLYLYPTYIFLRITCLTTEKRCS